MKTLLQVIKDEVYYPVSDGMVENKLIFRGLEPGQEFSLDTLEDTRFIGALADSLYSLIQAVNISEGDKSIGALTDSQRKAILTLANKYYNQIGEEEKTDLIPKVYINC